MAKATGLTVVVLLSAMGCWAQNFVTVQVNGNQKFPAVEADKVYLSACSVVQKEFGGNRVPRPQVTLILGAEVNGQIGTTAKSNLSSGTRISSHKESSSSPSKISCPLR
jgi:hypothetical protein